MSDQERESRKRKLKENVIFGEKDREENKEAAREGKSRAFTRKNYSLPLLFFLIFLLGIGVYIYSKRRFFRISSRWSTEFSDKEGSVAEYFSFADGVVKISKDGASYISSSGKILWNQAYEMTAPLFAIHGNYMVIGEENGSEFYILSAEGLSGQGESSLPIKKLSISEKGVVYALLTDEDSSYITVFNKEGKNLDIVIKSVLSGDGFPMDFSVSKDGEELLVAYSYLDKTVLKSRAVFYNFSSLGENAGADRVVGGFTGDYSGKMLGRVHFFSNEESFAAYNGGVSFFSTRVKTSPEEKKNCTIPGTIKMIAYDEGHLALLTDNTKEKEEENCRLLLFRKNGEKVLDKALSFSGSKMDLSGDKIFLYQEKAYQVYDFSGRLRYNGESKEGLLYLRSMTDFKMNGTELMLCFPNKVERVVLQ